MNREKRGCLLLLDKLIRHLNLIHCFRNYVVAILVRLGAPYVEFLYLRDMLPNMVFKICFLNWFLKIMTSIWVSWRGKDSLTLPEHLVSLLVYLGVRFIRDICSNWFFSKWQRLTWYIFVCKLVPHDFKWHTVHKIR